MAKKKTEKTALIVPTTAVSAARNSKKKVAAQEAMALRIKITPMGGYVMGDGECPFDPDTFLMLFGSKVMEAQRQGLEELGFTKAELDVMLAEKRIAFRDMVMNADTKTVLYDHRSDTVGRLLDNVAVGQ